ncbi:MAG: hypothetical protein ACI8XM_002962 [Haloarculaceae archaeon]|jgi:hypothetical protein
MQRRRYGPVVHNIKHSPGTDLRIVSEPTADETPRKRPWLAVLLAILYPGLGHIYLRKWGRALLWFALIVTSALFLVPGDAEPTALSADAILTAAEAIPTEVSLLILGLSFLSVFDAYMMANRVNEMARPTVDSAGEVQVESCPSCGKDLDEELEFCPWCSHQLVDTEPDEDDA